MNVSHKNYNQEAPWWWKRFESASVFTITGLIPLVGLSELIPEEYRNEIAMVILPVLMLFIKGFGILLGQPPQASNLGQLPKKNEDGQG